MTIHFPLLAPTSANAVALLKRIHPVRADDTQSWQAICIALRNLGVPYEEFEAWSLTERHRDKAQIRRAWQNLRGNHSIGTLCFYAKQDAGMPPMPHDSGRFDGEKAFAALIAPYADYSESDLECELWERSPYRLDHAPGIRDAEVLLENLYDPGDLLFIGDKICPFERQRGAIRSVAEHLKSMRPAELFRPNPLTGEAVTLDSGKQSLIADGCVAKFRYAVIEFDSCSLRDQIAFFLAVIDKKLPLEALTFSGNKSIHGLLAVNCPDAAAWEHEVEEKLFRSYLEPLGCDGACKNESRMSRLPGVARSSGAMQKLLYLNPNWRA
jgi:hypothetical protein